MPAASDQLTEIHAQITDLFDSHPHIDIVPTRGNPPDQYEITYRITGLQKGDDGQVSTTEDIVVEISIPFGFPHFPPSCKPKTPIFHPDFDPAAICLGDFWEMTPSLPELILYIGKMINGEHYSLDNAFDEEAAHYYQENSATFPLAAIDWEPRVSGQAGSRNEPILDMIDDLDLETDEAAFGDDLEDITGPASTDTKTASHEAESSTRLSTFSKLSEQRKYYTLANVQESVESFGDTENGMLEHARQQVAEVRKIHQNAETLEEEGKLEEALELYRKISSKVSDYPGIATDIKRAEQSLALLNELEPSTEPDQEAKAKETPVHEPVRQPDQGDKPPSPKTDSRKAGTPGRSPATSKIRGASKLAKPLLLVLLVLLTIAGSLGFLVYRDAAQLKTAEELLNSCRSLAEQQQFKEADKKCGEVRTALQSVLFFRQNDKEILSSALAKITDSEEFRQGIQGKVKYNGGYISAKSASLLKRIEQRKKDGDEAFREHKWDDAINAFQSIVDMVPGDPGMEGIRKESLRQLKISRFNKLYDRIRQLYAEEKWQELVRDLEENSPVVAATDESLEKEKLESLQQMRLTSQLQIVKSEADKYFSESDWDHAISTYRQLFDMYPKENQFGDEHADDIRLRLVKAELYKTVSTGNNAFANADWKEAIRAYDKASTILLKNQELLGMEEAHANHRKLGRVILQAYTIQDKGLVQAHLEKGEKSKALALLKTLAERIEKSPFANESEFRPILTETNTRIRELKQEIFLDEKKSYLLQNFKDLFSMYYPVSSKENLIQPKASFVREDRNRLIFKLQCTESGAGRPLNLVMFYGWNKTSRNWSLVAEDMQ